MHIEEHEISTSTTVSYIETNLDQRHGRAKKRRSLFKKNCSLSIPESSFDADISTIENPGDLTPGSLEIWLDLPDEIKFDPSLASFKQLYEQQHGKLEVPQTIEEERSSLCNGKELNAISNGPENANGTLHSEVKNGFVNPAESNHESAKISTRKKKFDRALRIIKMSALVASWVFLTASLIMNREQTDTVLHTAVARHEIKEYPLHTTNRRFKVLVTLTGPFTQVVSNSNNYLNVWVHRDPDSSFGLPQDSSVWSVQLQPDEKLDFSPSDTETKVLDLRASNSSEGTLGNETSVTLRMSTNSSGPVPLTLSYLLNPVAEADGILYATILLLTLYVLVIFELVNRTLAALLCSSLGVAVLALVGCRPPLTELLSWLDVETLLLLFSMMLLVAIVADTGLFDYLALVAFEVTGGRTWPLINCLCLFTAIFSTFLDNVTTVLLMTPVTIRLCEVMQLNPVPVLMSMVIFSNVGGAATPVGDPPNVIIASHPSVLHENINFTSFTLHMGVGILLVGVQTYFQLRFMYRDINKLRHNVPMELLEMRQEIAVWRRAAASLSSYSKDEDIVRRALEKKVAKLNTELLRREAGGGASRTDPAFSSTLAYMKEKYCIRDKPLLIKSTLCICFVIVVFFLHSIPELQRLSLGWTALLGALLLLLLSEREDLEPVLARVEWSTLLFFAALFVMMEVLSKLGLISWIGKITESLILSVDEESRLAVAIMLILWVSGLASAFVDNIPLTTMMVRVTAALSRPDGLALPLAPLAWALSFGACLGGNGTLIGASANVVCAGVAEQHGYRFTFMEFLKVGFPIMIGNLLVASVYLLLCHCVFEWH